MLLWSKHPLQYVCTCMSLYIGLVQRTYVVFEEENPKYKGVEVGCEQRQVEDDSAGHADHPGSDCVEQE